MKGSSVQDSEATDRPRAHIQVAQLNTRVTVLDAREKTSSTTGNSQVTKKLEGAQPTRSPSLLTHCRCSDNCRISPHDHLHL